MTTLQQNNQGTLHSFSDLVIQWLVDKPISHSMLHSCIIPKNSDADEMVNFLHKKPYPRLRIDVVESVLYSLGITSKNPNTPRMIGGDILDFYNDKIDFYSLLFKIAKNSKNSNISWLHIRNTALNDLETYMPQLDTVKQVKALMAAAELPIFKSHEHWYSLCNTDAVNKINKLLDQVNKIIDANFETILREDRANHK